ncbi:hypothetical protein [Alteromonas lipotrueiana]|uniref:hypothetical protein n=1 Tax=Alteromonas lipotrueiana TaxID=2803815 RepID=UPI001C490741|nr:hypothetical protein [Alteromonas lipotrueiana]
MKILNAFKIAYILFVILIVIMFAAGDNMQLYATYLLFGALSLFSVMLHTIINKLDALAQKIEGITATVKEP